ncbi:MAG: hypothetical protein JXK04_08570 [Campylobacterales bacterium]|nr:hypothetical protein [Campylobacterales bacterium]
MWLSKFKAALVLEETDRIATLAEEMPLFDSPQEMEEAAYLLNQARELMEQNKLQTAQTLKQLKNTLDFLKSTQAHSASSLNIKL